MARLVHYRILAIKFGREGDKRKYMRGMRGSVPSWQW